ncbi:hypothetical protein [Flavisolibacter tropicus]|uniref:Uncharacterized protein n=1 Tax=Flavisolibacter tropicus TaxID=1492898 RepID=A0A172TRI5_9BACT|nr:hypothetical protein [Flavisolibacter tropicus]ANE49640.1 hypothetical protein SY85_03090 [Flavisolibacter tropicus]
MSPGLALGQKSKDCSNFKNGCFHSYPINSADHYILHRDGATQKEINAVTGDSIIWKLDWNSDCSYSLKYISGSKLKREELAVLKQHTFFYEITENTPDYYLFNGYLENKKGALLQSDTMWLKEKAVTPNTLLFAPTDPNAVRKARFSDTSTYALLYIYRPKRNICFLADYTVYGNDMPMFVSKNNSRYILKIYKEGPLKLKAKGGLKDDNLEINIRFGQKYYLGALIKFGGYCTPLLTLEKEETGKLEFDNIL